MKSYGRVMVATDFSADSVAAAHRGADVARRFGATLTLLHVVEHFPEDMPFDGVAPENVSPAEYYLDRARRDLAALAERIGRPEATQEVVVSTGSARQEILQFAAAGTIDLIIVGSHGGEALGPFGSTAIGITHYASCDVLVVRAAGLD